MKVRFQRFGVLRNRTGGEAAVSPDSAERVKVDALHETLPPPESNAFRVPLGYAGRLDRWLFLWGVCMGRVRRPDPEGDPLSAPGDIRMSEAADWGKRLFDTGLSLLLLVLLLPVFPVVALLVCATSSGPALFRHVRVGRNGIPFRIVKFRTLHAHTPPYQISPAPEADERVTSVGRFLRRSGLDELPQLVNVLRGEMSLVGPRPEMPFIVAQYSELERERLRVPPGITGLWQISVARGRPIHENMAYDLCYLRNRSYLLDVVILVRTALFALFGMKIR